MTALPLVATDSMTVSSPKTRLPQIMRQRPWAAHPRHAPLHDRAAVETALAEVRAASTALQAEAKLLLLKTFDEMAAKGT